MTENKPWEKYYERSKELPQSPFLKFALDYVVNTESAIDIGAGTMKDTELIVGYGFKQVKVMDVNPAIKDYVPPALEGKIELEIKNLTDFDYPPNSFDLVYASKVFHYVKPEIFDEVLTKVLASIKKDGLFVAGIIGDKSNPEKKLNGTYPTLEEIKSKFNPREWQLIKATQRGDFEVDAIFGTHLLGIIAKKIG